MINIGSLIVKLIEKDCKKFEYKGMQFNIKVNEQGYYVFYLVATPYGKTFKTIYDVKEHCEEWLDKTVHNYSNNF